MSSINVLASSSEGLSCIKHRTSDMSITRVRAGSDFELLRGVGVYGCVLQYPICHMCTMHVL